MSATQNTALIEGVKAILDEIQRVEAAKPPLEQEISAALLRLETVVGRAEANPPFAWLSPSPTFSPATLADSMTGALLLIAPDKVRELVAQDVRHRGEAWRGLRLTAGEKERALAKLQTDLRVRRARIEVGRRELEAASGEMQPRPDGDPSVCPSIWLMMPAELAALAASNGKEAK